MPLGDGTARQQSAAVGVAIALLFASAALQVGQPWRQDESSNPAATTTTSSNATPHLVTVLSVSPRDASSVVVRLRHVRPDGTSDTENRLVTVTSEADQLWISGSQRIGAG